MSQLSKPRAITLLDASSATGTVAVQESTTESGPNIWIWVGDMDGFTIDIRLSSTATYDVHGSDKEDQMNTQSVAGVPKILSAGNTTQMFNYTGHIRYVTINTTALSGTISAYLNGMQVYHRI